MNITGIHHTGLVVSDLDRSIYFYHDVLGLPFAVRADGLVQRRGARSRRGGAQRDAAPVHVLGRAEHTVWSCCSTATCRPTMDRPYPNNTLGAGHVCLQVDDVRAAKAELEAKGVEFYSDVNVVDEGPLAGWRWVYFAGSRRPLARARRGRVRRPGRARCGRRRVPARPSRAAQRRGAGR